MAVKKEAFTSDGVCRIIETAGKNGVMEIHFGDVSIFFTPERQMLERESRKPSKSGKASAAIRKVQGKDPIFPATKSEEESLAIQEEHLRAEQFAELMLTDPAQAERLAMEAAEKDLVTEEEDDGED